MRARSLSVLFAPSWLRVLFARLAEADDDAAAGPVLAALARLEARGRAGHRDDDDRDEDDEDL